VCTPGGETQSTACAGAGNSLDPVPATHLLPDLTPFRRSRDLRLVVAGELISNLGTQAALVALPFQLYLVTRSALLVGLLGAVELGPLIAMSLFGGALADRMDRRRLLLLVQIGVASCVGGLAAVTFAGHAALWTLYVLGGLLAGFNALQNTAYSAMIPNLVADRTLLGPALATSYGLSSLTMVLGPGLGGVLIALVGPKGAYLVDVAACGVMAGFVLRIAAQPPHAGGVAGESIPRSIAEGLRYVRGNRALLGSFAIDLVAMTFGMPRALFAVLAVSVYHAGAGGTGLLYSAVAGGATITAMLSGWIKDARRLGVICIWAVTVWGAAITIAGLMGSIWLAALLLAVAGAADSVSAVCRSTINQTVTPDAMRGRMSAVFGLVVTGGPRLGDIESGSVAGITSPRFSVVSGGLACLAGVALIALACPSLVRYDTADWLKAAPELEAVAPG
jgi:MFS family permease